MYCWQYSIDANRYLYLHVSLFKDMSAHSASTPLPIIAWNCEKKNVKVGKSQVSVESRIGQKGNFG